MLSRSSPCASALFVAVLAGACGGDPPAKPPEPEPVPTTITISPAEATLQSLGETVQLTATVLDQNGQVMTGVTVNWTSSNASVATVSSGGLVTGMDNGAASVQALAGAAMGTADVTVEQRPVEVRVSPSADTLFALGDTLRLAAEARDANGHVVADVEFAWSSSDESVATVDTVGLVHAVSDGEATITTTSGPASGTAVVRVARVARISVSPLMGEIVLGDTLRLVAQAEDADGNELSGIAFDWASDNETIAAVDGEGLVRAIIMGTVTITATAADVSGSAVITVVPNPDRVALVALFESMSGSRWVRSDNWLTDAPLENWYGVEVGGNGRVTSLDLHENNLSGPIPPALADLSELTYLALYNNYLTDSIPGALGGLSKLTHLLLTGNRLTGKIPPEMGDLGELRVLWIGRIGLTGPIPPELGRLSNLVDLSLDVNELSGSIPAELGELSNLETLWLRRNNLSGPIPPELGRLTKVTMFGLSQNALSGSVPAELGNLSSVRLFWLNDNHLTGSIPAELGNLNLASAFYLHNNDLTGPIPSELGRLSGLWRMYLYGNELSGPIPAEFGGMTNLREAFLFDNDLSGPIPPEMGNLVNLQLLWLSNNDLTGPVPPALGGMEELQQLDVTNNAGMSGALPATLTDLNDLTALLAGGTDLCAPEDDAFQDWLRGVRKVRLTNCVTVGAVPLYLTQAVQSPMYPVPLVADEQALLRVFVTAEDAMGAGIPLVRARFHLEDAEVHVAEIPAQTTEIPKEMDESDLAKSANAGIPGSVLQPGLEMVVVVDPEGTLDPSLGVTRRIPAEGRLEVDVRAMPVLDLTMIPFLWSEAPDSTILDLTDGMTGDDTLFWDTRNLLPVGGLDVAVHEPVTHASNSAFALLAATRAIRAMEGGTGHYMGMMSGRVTGAFGIAGTPGRASFSIPHSSVMAHEFGHNMSLLHAPGCETGGPDPAFPEPDGSIGVWGYDFRDGGLLVPPDASDLMTYCHPRWVGEFHFTNALRFRLIDEGGPAPPSAAAASGLLLWGGIDAQGVPFLEPAFAVDAPPLLPQTVGDYEISGTGGDGALLFSFSFDMPMVADGDGSSSFAFMLPVRHEWAGALAGITLSGPHGSFTLDGNSDQAVVILRNPRTGQVRAILRDVPPGQVEIAPPMHEAGLEVLFSRGIPEVAAWRH